MPKQSGYKPNVTDLLATCEGNYMLLMRLLPATEPVARCFEYGVDDHIDIRLTIIDVSPYTNLIEIEQLTSGLPPFLQARMQVRCYHDARVAEVTQYQNIGRLQAKYEYPNPVMHQQDEKSMHNKFLREWLVFCLRNGYCKKTVDYLEK